MVVGVAAVEIHVHGSRSLKEKRGVVQSIKRRVRNRFNLSVAEVGGQDTWQRALIGLSACGASASTVRPVLERAIAFIEDMHVAEVLDSDVEMMSMPLAALDEEGPWREDEEA